MKLRTFAMFAALALPAVAGANQAPADYPPTNNAPTNNTPSTQPTPSGRSGTSAPYGTPGTTSPSGTNSPSDTNSPSANDTGRNSDTMRNDATHGTDTATSGGKLNDGDSKIVAHLHHVNQMEITMARLAQKSGTARVKDYANTLLSDHQSNDKDLTAFAKSHKLANIPADKPQSDADRQDEKDMTTSTAHLKTLKGAEFDKEFLTMMQSGHDKELTKIDVAISGATDPDLKSLLQSTKPVLQRHADQARDLAKSPQASTDMPSDKLPSQRANSGH